MSYAVAAWYYHKSSLGCVAALVGRQGEGGLNEILIRG